MIGVNMSSSPKSAPANHALCHDNWLSVLSDSAKEVFSKMVGTELQIPKGDPEVHSEITAIVGLAGKLCGIFVVRCSSDSAKNVASLMLGVTEEGTNHAQDAIGEVCNMVAGNFKAKIGDLEDTCMLSVPTVIQGHSYQLHALAGKRIELPLMFEQEAIWFTLEIRN